MSPGHSLATHNIVTGHNLKLVTTWGLVTTNLVTFLLLVTTCQPVTTWQLVTTCELVTAWQLVTGWHLVTTWQLVTDWQLVTTLIPAALYRITLRLQGTLLAWSHLATGHTWQRVPGQVKLDHGRSPREGFGSISLTAWEE